MYSSSSSSGSSSSTGTTVDRCKCSDLRQGGFSGCDCDWKVEEKVGGTLMERGRGMDELGNVCE